MNSLRIRFAIGFSILYTIFLSDALLIVYITNANYREEEFYMRLKDRSLTTFKFLVEVEQIDDELLRVIDRNTLNTLYNEKVMIFEGNRLKYSSIDDQTIDYDDALLEKTKKEKEIHFSRGENELVALYVRQKDKDYTILASAYDKYGRKKMSFLKWIMLIVYFTGLLVGWAATYFFVKRVIRPLDLLKRNIQHMTYDNLHMRLQEKGRGEEVDSLASHFNEMLERLQQAFSIQKDFVLYASHELRTPLAAMIGITENAMGKKLDAGRHEEILKKLFHQQQHLAGITNSLLLLSDKKMNDQQYPGVRLDELVFLSVEIVQSLFPEAQIQVNLEGQTPSEQSLTVQANQPLLLMAFNNLLKNAVQYSQNNQAIVNIRLGEKGKEVQFKNKGTLFTPEELQLLFTPFYRATNAKMVKGNGLGLHLVKQIAELHNATIDYYYQDPYNVFCFYFNNRIDTNNQYRK